MPAVRAFVASLLPHIASLTPAERYAIFQQSGLFDIYGKSKSFIKAVATGRFPQEELEKFVHGAPSLADEFLGDDSLTMAGQESASRDATLVDGGPQPVDEMSEEQPLPIVQTRDALAVWKAVEAG